MRCQSIMNYSSQVCWRQVSLREQWLRDSYECENDKIWILDLRKDMSESKMKPRYEELTKTAPNDGQGCRNQIYSWVSCGIFGREKHNSHYRVSQESVH